MAQGGMPGALEVRYGHWQDQHWLQIVGLRNAGLCGQPYETATEPPR